MDHQFLDLHDEINGAVQLVRALKMAINGRLEQDNDEDRALAKLTDVLSTQLEGCAAQCAKARRAA